MDTVFRGRDPGGHHRRGQQWHDAHNSAGEQSQHRGTVLLFHESLPEPELQGAAEGQQ